MGPSEASRTAAGESRDRTPISCGAVVGVIYGLRGRHTDAHPRRSVEHA
jgi:hypothetical protein